MHKILLATIVTSALVGAGVASATPLTTVVGTGPMPCNGQNQQFVLSADHIIGKGATIVGASVYPLSVPSGDTYNFGQVSVDDGAVVMPVTANGSAGGSSFGGGTFAAYVTQTSNATVEAVVNCGGGITMQFQAVLWFYQPSPS